MSSAVGRRERKKAATRQALADAALELFCERGFEQVGVREIADAADVSTATLFKHFPVKEALVFDREDDQEQALLGAVRRREPGVTVLAALRTHLLDVLGAVDLHDTEIQRYHALLHGSPALREYSRRMWLRYERSLTEAITEQAPEVHPTICAALAHYVLEIRGMLHDDPDPAAAVERIFALLEDGWDAQSTDVR